MPTLHSLYRCGQVTHVGIPRVYNVAGLAAADCGNVQKTYSLSARAKRTIQSSLVKQYTERKSNITFLTFTFRRCAETDAVVTDQRLMNVYIGKLLENFKKSYGLYSYVWVSELTKKGTIHYHAVLDFPKLTKKKYEVFCAYSKTSFKEYLKDCSCVIDDTDSYSNVGLPSRYDRNGRYCGAVVRNLEAVLVYISGYLKKSDRVETKGRIYAISRNVLQKPVKTFSFETELEIETDSGKVRCAFTQTPRQTYTHQYCSVDYYQCTTHYQAFFKYMSLVPQIVTMTDFHRKADTRYSYTRGKYRNLAKITQNNRSQPVIIDWNSHTAIPQQYDSRESIEDMIAGSMPHTVVNHYTDDFKQAFRRFL